MKTLLSRMKTAVQENATLADYVKTTSVETVSPGILPELSQDNIPYIGLAPVNSPESWISSARKEVVHTVDAYLVQWYPVQETAIIGADDVKGILDLIIDFKAAVRGSYFASAAKPTKRLLRWMFLVNERIRD